jgi:microcin C transport system substrate-binding protein
MLKKGDIDFMELTPEQYVLKAVGPEWGKKVIKVKTENKMPKGYGFIAWNLRKEMFKDKEVRKALAMLVNRPLMNEKFRFNMSLLQTGPIYVTSDYASPNVKPVPFDPPGALKILEKAGWSDKDKNGVLEKEIGGKKVEFKFTLMTAAEDFMKYLTIIKQDAKQIGVDIDLKVVEWNTFTKLLDESNFDSMTLAWGGGSVDPDLKQIWHSSSATKGGSNFGAYSNPAVDKLIDESRETMDKKKRIEIMRKAYEMIADDAPYAWFFSNKYTLYAHSARTKLPKDTYQFAIGYNHWWAE